MDKDLIDFIDFALQNLVETTLSDGLEASGRRRIANFGIFLDFLRFCVFGHFFRFSKKSGFGVFLVHPETMLPDGLETSGQRVYR